MSRMSGPWQVSHLVSTDSGMCALWQPEHFDGVTSLDEWEDEVAEDAALERHIAAGAFVPVNVGGDGAFRVIVRAGGLTHPERAVRLVSSEPAYLLVSQGQVALGGLEDVGAEGDPILLPLAAGRYSVTVHLIDWQAVASPAEGALPDFVVEIGADSGAPYRASTESFDRP